VKTVCQVSVEVSVHVHAVVCTQEALVARHEIALARDKNALRLKSDGRQDRNTKSLVGF